MNGTIANYRLKGAGNTVAECPHGSACECEKCREIRDEDDETTDKCCETCGEKVKDGGFVYHNNILATGDTKRYYYCNEKCWDKR